MMSDEFARRLGNWWSDAVSQDLQRTIPKIAEYGTHDLAAIGHAIRPDLKLSDDQAAVYGIMFYTQGKVARALASLSRGEMPSEDTLFDMSVYTMMARFYRSLQEDT